MERENVNDVDPTLRYEDEWGKLYFLTVSDEVINSERMSEFEWAFRLNYATYTMTPDVNGSYDLAALGEARAMAILTDILANADPAERKMLKSGVYLETKYVLKYLTTH